MLWLTAVILAIIIMSCVNSQIVLFDGSQPAIFQVSPNIGGLIGGTNIKIYGANFQPSGLFSNLVVYIGNDLCEINNYYTTNEQIYCVTPPCATDDCLNQSPGYSAWVSVDISLFVETVEGILGAYSTYYYSSYYTPTISYVSTFTWASSIGSINTNVYTDSLDKFTIKINNHFVNLGTNDELNYDDFNWYNWQTNTIYFIPPGDMTAGFYNLTMQLTNSDSLTETLSTGYAKTYPDDSSENIYSSTLSGVAYSTAVYPVITNIYPNSGSLAGGTTITIKGSGFSTSSELLTVLVGGKSCKVISSSINTIVCITDEVDSIDSIKQSIISNPHFERYKYSNVSTGSPGMWIKFWDYNDNVYHRTGNIAYVKMSFAWRQGSTFSLSDNYGLSWPSTFNFNSDTSYNQYFYAEVGTVLIAPISGYYTIYARVDDNLILYGSLEGMGINEKVINYVPYYTTYSTSFNIFSGQISSPIYLVDGQKMYLRGVWTNAGLSSDALYLSLKIQLPENISSTLNPTCYPTNLPSSKIDLLTLNQRILKDINSSDYSNLVNNNSFIPTIFPTDEPTILPISLPTIYPTAEPTDVPSSIPSIHPTIEPTDEPSSISSIYPTIEPTDAPSSIPSIYPTDEPTDAPSSIPSIYPTDEPTDEPSVVPSIYPTDEPTSIPSSIDYLTNQPTLPCYYKNFPDTFMRYYSVREIQQIKFSFSYYYEIQEIRFNNVVSGNFAIVIQNYASTSLLTINSSTSLISEALNYAASIIPSNKVQCQSFGVQTSWKGSTYSIYVSFIVDNSYNASFLQILDYTAEQSLSYSIFRKQSHSRLPSGSFNLIVNSIYIKSIPFSVSDQQLRYLINSADSKNDVLVSYSGGYYTGQTWLITFVRPRGNIPKVIIDSSKITGENFNVNITTVTQGSLSTLFFDTIPLWMLEIPLSWATNNKTTSTVEVYQTVSSSNSTIGNDTMKAICDNSGTSYDTTFGLLKGNETTCAYQYLISMTPVVNDFNITNTTTKYSYFPTYNVIIIGSGFLLANLSSNVIVTIGPAICNITGLSDNEINCSLTAVSYGTYTVNVTIIGIGSAVLFTNKTVTFDMMILNIIPVYGSLAGGQLVTISGYGFHLDNLVYLDSNNSICSIKYIDIYKIICEMPPSTNNSSNLSTRLRIKDKYSPIFTYSLEHTPIVSSISPNSISSAITTLIEIKFLNEISSGQNNTVIHIDDSVCTILNFTISSIVCKLSRNLTSLAAANVNAYIYIPDKGYAATLDNYQVTPKVDYGFEIYSVSPLYGSIYGGTNLSINGFGFASNESSLNVVTLSDTIGSDSYTILVKALGLHSSLTRHIESCDILFASFHKIICYINFIGSPLQYSDNNLLLGLTIAGASPFISSGSVISFTQSLNYTPVVYSISNQILSNGVMSFDLNGENLFDKSASTYVFVSTQSCLIDCLLSNVSRLSVQCFNLIAGDYQPTVLISELGYAKVNANVTILVELDIQSINFSNTIGSVGGGVIFTVNGFGFDSICENMNISFVLESISSQTLQNIQVTYYFKCSYYHVVGYMPPIPVLFTVSNFTVNVVKLEIEVHGKTANISSLQLFQYSTTVTPIIYSYQNQKSVFDNNTEFLVYVPLSNIKSTQFETTRFGIYRGYCNQTSLMGSLASTNISINCITPTIAAGLYTVYVEIFPYGYALLKSSSGHLYLPTYQSVLLVDEFITTEYSSIAGGKHLKITGEGMSSNLTVTVCEINCPIVASSYNRVICEVPAYRTTDFVDYIDSLGITIDMIETVDTSIASISTGYGSYSYNMKYAFDQLYTTYYSHYTYGCYVGIKMTGNNRIQPYRMRFYPAYQAASSISDISFEGSLDGGISYITLDSIDSANEGWNFLSSNSTLWFTHLRYKAYDSSYCRVAELKFLGVVASYSSNCNVDIQSSDSVFHVGNISYSENNIQTAKILSVSPLNGTSLGGTIVTLTGLFNSLNDTNIFPNVTINGINCSVTSYSIGSISCISGYRGQDNIQTRKLSVFIPNYGYAVSGDDVYYIYMDKWSELTTWKNQNLPVDGDFVWIPDGQSIVLDVDTPLLEFLLIQGELYFDNTKPSINLDAYYVFVYGGLLQIGTELQPYENNVTITIYGDRYKNIDIPEIGYKCIAVASLGLPKESQTSGFHLPGKDQGQLEIHGQKRLRTWTKLAKTAYAGSSIILTSEPVDFKAGDILVLSGTEVQSNEDFSIDIATVAENLDNHNITLTDPLRYTHRSEIVVVSGRTVDLRGEVGLLSRNIIIQGDDQSQGQLFGVHMVARMSGIFRVENAEIRRCGQGFLLGRYCTHSHKAGNMEGSYVKANSIHNSFQRAVTTHDTFYWEVRDNVAYNVLGHTFFVEDGTEKYNTISGNLGIRTKLSSASLSSDQKPAVFWTSGPTNFWYDNVGSNSDSFGFWFELGEHPNNFLADGDYDVCPVHEKLGEFRNNTVRGNAMIGLRIYPEYTPLQDPCDSNSDPSPQYLYDLVSYRNGQGLFSKRHGDLHHIGYSLIENAGNGISIVKYQHVNYTTDPAISNAVIVGSLDGNFDLSTNFGYVAVWLPQNEYFFISDINIINYGVSGAFSGCNECDSGEMFAQGGITTRFLNMKFSNTSRKILWTPHYKEIFWDLDGSLLNINGGGMVTYFYSFNLWTANCFQPDISIYDYSIICNNTSYIRRMTLDAFTPSSLAYYSLTITSAIGFDFIPFLPRDIYGWVFPIVENQSYQFSWSIAETSASRFSLNFAHSPYLKESYALGRNESIQINYQPYSWDYIPVDFVNTFYDKSFWVSTNKTVSLLGRMGDSYYNTNISKLSMIISTDGADFDYPWNEEGYDHVCYISTSARLCPQSGCYVPPTQDVHHLQYWSKNSTWIGHGGSLPSAGSSFNISSTQWIVLDISPPPLDTLVVYGKLSFLSGSNTEITLRVRNLQVFGTLEINGHVTVNGTRNVTDPYIGNATIVIYGTKSQSSPVVLGEGLFIGSKVIAVAGSMIAKGLTTADSYVKLNQTALKGSNTIYVTTVSQLGWTDGDEIVISTTSYFSDTGSVWSNSSSPNNEIRRITAIKNYDGIAVITVDYPLQNTHACYERAGVSFCGVVGLLSRNIRIISEDISAGFGGHIAVVDILSTSVDGASYFIGNISFDNVQFINIGKLNTDYYGIGINYRQIYDATYSNSIINCAFKNSYNYAIYTSYTSNITINNNIIAGVFGGGVFIDETCSNVIVTNNAVLGLQQFPGIYQNGYAWVVPIASFTFNSLYGYYASNLAAGSVDTGFSVATSVFSGYSAGSVVSTLFDSISDISPCTNTYGSQAYFDLSNVLENSVFVTNEAVGCKVGLMVVVNSADESESSTCAVVSGMISWRNSHIGIGGVDAIANTLLHQVVVAENHIGISFSYFRSDDDVYSGVIDSIIIGSLRDNLSTCNDSTTSFYDSNWGIQKCQVFSEYDPFGQSIECNSVLRESIYNRVGILMTQSTNAAKTCRLANTFASGTCDPSLTPDRLCSLPWEKRYGLPSGNLYSELHIHNNTFSGFSGDQSCESVFGVAVGLNPSQIDLNPVIVSSDSTWLDQDKGNMDISARLGLFISPEYTCANDDCMGHKMLLIHDYRSFLKDTADNLLSSVTDRENVQGQIVYNNPEYVGSSAVCTEASALGDSLYSCLSVISPKSKSSSDFKEYTGLWQDYEEAGDNVVIGPITVYRYSTYDLFNERSYSSYSAKRDPCPDIDPSNRFPLLIASGYYHHLLPAGQLPTSWFIRWDAPSENDSAVLDFYIQGSYVMNVFVGPSEDEITMRHISSMDSTPGLFDKAGSNGRNPQTRNLTLTVRGGENNRYYLLRQLPTIQVTIKMEMNLSMFFSDTFVANIATLLHIPITRIKIASVRKGSVIVDFQVYPNVTVVQTHSDLVAQIVELQQVANNFTTVVSNGALEKLLNVTISRLSLQPPTIPTTDATTNSSATVSSSFDSSPILLIGTQYPTSAPTVKTTPFPTNFPSKKPSSTPTNVPTRSPTVYPSPIQSITPTLLPTLSPTLSPTNSPTNSLSGETVQPTVYLTYIPTSSPSEIPTDAPSTTPTNAPIVINQTSHITSNPSNFPTLSPTVQIGASVPINPTSSPSISPTSLTTSISNTSSSKSSKSKSSATVIIATSVTAAFIFIIGVVFYYIRSTKINKIASSNGFQLNNNRNNYLLESGNA